MDFSELPDEPLEQLSGTEVETEAINFNYADLDTQTRSVVQKCTSDIKEQLYSAVKTIWNIGQKLAEVREQLGYGLFCSWLKTEFQWSKRTAYNYINVFESFSFANFAKLNITASALYLLAAPSTPDAARSEAIERANSGESISLFEAKVIIQRYKQADLLNKPKKNKPIASDAVAQTPEPEPFTAAKPTNISPVHFPLELEDSIEVAQASEENVARAIPAESIETELKRRAQELGLVEDQQLIPSSDDDSEIGKSSSSTITSEVLCRAITSNVKLLSDEQVPSVLSTTIAATFPRLLPEQVVEAITNASTNQQLSSNNLRALIKAAEQALRFRQQLDE